jgi:hypothetical protein
VSLSSRTGPDTLSLALLLSFDIALSRRTFTACPGTLMIIFKSRAAFKSPYGYVHLGERLVQVLSAGHSGRT